jgi:hypothetical protein
LQGGKALQPFPGTILAAELADLLNCFAKKKEVVGPNLLADLHISPIQSTDGKGTIHAELHVAGAGGLQAGRGDLLGKIGGRIHFFSNFDIVIRHENHLKQTFAIRVVVDDLSDPIDEADDQLGHVIAGGGFAAEKNAAGHHSRSITLLDAQILDD